MATISKDKGKNLWKINYYKPSLRWRSSFSIGNITGSNRVGQKARDKKLRIVNELEEAFDCRESPGSKTLTEIAGMGEKFQKKIEKTG